MRKLVYADNEIKSLKPGDIKAVLESDKADDYLVIDVRQPDEYKQGHIPGALLIPLCDLEAKHNDLPRDKMIIVYCRSGHRSKAGAVALSRLGFKGVCFLDGGIINWPHETSRGMPSARAEEIVETEDIQDILVLAIRQEKGSRDFYMAAMNKSSVPEITWIFQMLADVEESHMQRLYQHAAGLLDEKALPCLDKLKNELKPGTKEGYIEFSSALSGTSEKLQNEMEMLEIALEKEFLSYDFYKRTSGMIVRKNAQTLFYELCMDERNHANILLKQLEKAIAR